MPELLWLYLTALLYSRTSGRCIALAECLETVSHDRLTRMLPGDWSGPTGLLSLDLDQSIDARFRDEHEFAVHLQHHKSFLVQGNQAPPLGLRLSPSIGIHREIYSAKHEHPPQPRSPYHPSPT
jgi:hypothetical protein